MIQQQKEIVQPHIDKIATGLGEIKESIVSSLSEDIKVPENLRDGFPDIERHEVKAHEKEIPPYFAEEESKWRDLMKRTIHPDHVDAYPYHECFKEGASQHHLPLSLVLGLAAYLSNFDPSSSLEHKAGIMHLGWPDPSEGMGIEKKATLINDPCLNIELGCRFLAQLLEQGDDEWVPSLVVYRNQSNVVRRDRITIEDLAFSARLRAHVEKVLQGPFKKMVMAPFLEFNNRETAEIFMTIVFERTGLDLWLGEKNYMYTIFIPAANDSDKENKRMLINEKAGINGKSSR